MYVISWVGPAVCTQRIIALRLCYHYVTIPEVFFSIELPWGWGGGGSGGGGGGTSSVYLCIKAC